MEEENLVTEVTENVEETTEQTIGEVVEATEQVEEVKEPRIYTKEQVDQIKINAKKNAERKIRKDYERKYGKLENVLRAGTGKEDLEEITTTFADFYTNKGINIPNEPTYSERDVEILARAEADDIISSGYEEVVEEANRLADIGVANMTPREKATFQRLAEYRRNEEARKELAKIGVGDKVLQDNEFVEFSKKLNPSLSVKEKYDLYSQFKPKPKVEPMGSMKNTVKEDGGVKDFYSFEEAQKFTKKDFDKNPALFKAVEQSMTKW